MKKFYIMVMLFLTISFPSFSQEEIVPENPSNEMHLLMQCVAVNTSMSNIYTQIAASFIALSSPKRQHSINLLINSYLDLANEKISRNKKLMNIAEEIFIPQFIAHGQSRKDINDVSNRLLNEDLSDINDNLANPNLGLSEKIAINKALQAKSDDCENHFQKVFDNHTF